MQQTIASTTGWPDRKISAPYARALITRARLTDPLTDAARAGRVVLIVAPGGTGKTSLLADWTRQAPLPVAWYSLDAADRDTRRLVSGILAAVERALPGTTGAPARMLEQGAAEMATMGMLLSALERHPLTLVLDDFQHLDDASDVAALWDHFFRFRPPSLSLVILSRTVPLLGFAALAAMDALVGLGLTDLSFDAEEAARLLEAHGLDATASPLLVRRSGGWATGMLLLARAGPDGIRQLRARQDAMMEHLGGEMLGALPPRVRTFLLESAVLGPVSPAEADGILQRRDSAMLFADLAARSLFLDRQNGTYRYHDLFAEYLIGVLAARAPARLHAIRSSAAVWWETHEDIPRALALLTDDEDWPALAAMLERTRAELWSRRLWGTISSYVERLPPVFRSVRLLELCGYAYCERGEFAPALAMVDAAMAIAGSDQEWLRPALLATQTLVLAGRYEEGIRSAEAGLEIAMRTGHSTAVSRLRRWRGGARLRLGHPEGRDDLLAALAVHRQMGDSEGEALVLAQLAAQLIESGQLGDVEDLLARAGVLWRRQSYNIGIATLHASWARYHALRGNLAQAREEAALSLALLEHDPHPMSQCDA
ncbi:MAG TPA: AAA family ATPase, partial [Chloroflexota bacterium]|nr:AAA family ATPase [Chloroflexota bacterium]